MNIKFFMVMLLSFIIYIPKNGAMLPSSTPSRQILEASKREMRKELDRLNESFRADPSPDNLKRLLNTAKAIRNSTANTDPQMARRAQTLIEKIRSEATYLPDDLE